MTIPIGIASAAAMPSPSAQPSSVLPTASQKLVSPSWPTSVPSVSLIGGKWSRGRTPMRGSRSNSASTPSTVAHGSAQSGTWKDALGRRAAGLATVATALLPDERVEVGLLVDQAVLLAELRQLLDRGLVEVRAPNGQLDLLGSLRWDLRVLGQHLSDLVRVRLRVRERLVHRVDEAVHDVPVLLRVLGRREVGGDRQIGRGPHVERVDPARPARLQRGVHVREGDLGELERVHRHTLLLERCLDRDLADVLEGVDRDGLSLEVFRVLD